MSTPLSLTKLREEYGFKTFDPFINEDYDREENDLKRMQMIFDELDKFRNKSDKELKDWWRRNITYIRTQSKNIYKYGK